MTKEMPLASDIASGNISVYWRQCQLQFFPLHFIQLTPLEKLGGKYLFISVTLNRLALTQ